MGVPGRIGDIQPFAELAQGATAVVYKGYQASLERFVLLKVLRPAYAQDEAAVRRFEAEARLVARVRHPNVVTVYGVGRDGDHVYLAAEFVEGADLAAVLASGPLPPALALYVLDQAARGLGAAHAGGVLHRDLKPANLLVAHDGAVKLADFGLASRLAEGPDDEGGSDAEAAEVRGTLAYLAPEQVLGAPPTPGADLFALGATCFEMLVGRRAFRGPDDGALLQAVLQHDPVPELDRAGVPPALRAVAARLLARDPADRYPDVAALVADLDRLRAAHAGADADAALLAAYLADPAMDVPPLVPHEPPAAPSEDAAAAPVAPKPTPPTAKRGRARLGWGVAVVLALALLGWGAAAGWGGGDAPPPAVAETTRPAADARPPADGAADDPAPPDLPAPEGATDDPSPSPETSAARDVPADVRRPATSEPRGSGPPVGGGDEPTTPSSPVPAMGTLQVACAPWASVVVVGAGRRDSLGVTPLAPTRLAVGAYELLLRNPDFPDVRVPVAVTPSDTTAVTVRLWDYVGRVELEVSPWAEVYIDGTYRDTTPQARPLILAPGRYELALHHPAFPAYRATLDVRAGETLVHRVRLSEVPR